MDGARLIITDCFDMHRVSLAIHLCATGSASAVQFETPVQCRTCVTESYPRSMLNEVWIRFCRKPFRPDHRGAIKPEYSRSTLDHNTGGASGTLKISSATRSEQDPEHG